MNPDVESPLRVAHPLAEAIRAQVLATLQPQMDLITEALVGIKDTLREQSEIADARFAELRHAFTPSIADVGQKITEYTAAIAARKATR